MSKPYNWHDGDTTYDIDGKGVRLPGVDAPEAANRYKGTSAEVGASQATEAAQLSKFLGYEPGPLRDKDVHGREVRDFNDPDGNSLSQAMANANLAAPMYGAMGDSISPTQAASRELLGMPKQGIEADPYFQHLADQARNERLAALDEYLASGIMESHVPGGEDPSERGVVGRAWNRGVDNLQSTLYGFANALGSATGVDPLKEYGHDGMMRNIWQAMENPASVASWEDIDSLADAGVYALEALVENSPQIAMDALIGLAAGAAASTGVGAPAAAGMILTRRGLAGIGKAALRNSGGANAVAKAGSVAHDGISRYDRFKAGGRFGALTSIYAQVTGETQMGFVQEGIDNPELALGLGIGKAALDLYGFEKILGQTFKGFNRRSSPDSIRQMLGSAAASAGIAAGAESITEGAQTLIDEFAIAAQKDGYEINWSEVVDAVLKGGLSGGAIGGAGRASVDTLGMMAQGYESGMQDAGPSEAPPSGPIPTADSAPPVDLTDRAPMASEEAPPVDGPEQLTGPVSADSFAPPTDSAPTQATLPEPGRDIEAQVRNTPDGEGNWYTAENAERAEAAAQEVGKAVRHNPDGSVFVASQEVIDTIPENPTQEDTRAVLGYAQTKEQAVKDPQGTVVVEVKDPQGAVLRNQVVGKSIAEEVRRQQQEKFPEAEVQITEAITTVEERSEAVAQEASQKNEPWGPKGLLNNLDVPELVSKAVERGIDPTRFQKEGFGVALVERITGGLKAVTGANKHRRLDSLEPLAKILGMPAQELTRDYYDSRNVIRGRDELLKVVQKQIREKFGSEAKFAEHLDQLPASEVRELGKTMGVEEEGGYDIGGLVSEIESRDFSNQREPTGLDALNRGLESPPPAPEAKEAQASTIHKAVMETPLLRQVLAGEDGSILTGDALDARIESMSRGQRLRLEQLLASWEIDIGEPNRELFLDLLEENLGERATYGVGRQLVDDESGSGATEAVQTVEFNPSILDSDDVSLIQLVQATPLSDRAHDGWPAGMSLYLDAMARAIKAGEEPTPVLSHDNQIRLHYARAMSAVAQAFSRPIPGEGGELFMPGFDPDFLLPYIAEELGVTDAIASAAAGREISAIEALKLMSEREDPRVGVSLLIQATTRMGLGGTLKEDAQAIGEALVDDPAKHVKSVLQELRSMYGDDGINRLALISFYEAHTGRGDRPLTATTKGRDAGQGENVAIDLDAAYNEQAMSDSTFFSSLDRMSIRGWGVALLPQKGQIKSLKFKSGVALENTIRFGGANLLPIPEISGSHMGRVTDAVSLALYAQSDESPPQSSAEAASNLMENISRIMLGDQSSEREDTFGVAKGFIRTIPDDLVIFVNRDSGQPVTFGEALTQLRKEGEAAEKDVILTREMDKLSDRANELGEAIAEAMSNEVAEETDRNRKRLPLLEEALVIWEQMISGEKRLVGGREVYRRRPSRRDNRVLRDTVDSIGRITIKSTGETLSNTFGEYLGTLSKIKKLSEQRKEAKNVQRRAPSYEEEDASKVARELGLDIDTPEGRREAEEALRGGQGTRVTSEDSENIDHSRGRGIFGDENTLEYDPSAHDPLAGLDVAAMLDGEDAAQDAAIAAWLEASKEVEGADDHPLFRMASTVVESVEKPKAPLTREEVDAVVQEFQDGFNGNIPLEFKVSDTQGEIYGPNSYTDRDGRPQTIKGAYHPTGRGRLGVPHTGASPLPGRLHIIAENAASREDLLETLRHEVLGHFGLNTFPPKIKRQILDAIQASKKVPGMRSIWAEISERYSDQTQDTQAEEVFAYITERDSKAPRPLRERILGILGVALRRLGLLQGKVTRAELETMAEQIAGAIRDGRARQRTWPLTDGASFRRSIPNAGVLGAQAKRFWDKGIGMAAPVASMVYSRIGRHSPELARMLFQPANADASSHGRSWQQQSRAIQDRMMAQADKLLTELNDNAKGNKAQKRQAVQDAFIDAYSSEPKTEAGKRVRTLVDALAAEARRSGLESVEFPEGFAPAAFDRRAVASRQGEFEKLLADNLKDFDGQPLPPREIAEISRNILDGPGVLEGVIAPGMPVGMHQNTRAIIDAIGMDKLMEGGWILNRHEAALMHWISGVSKRASWEKLFGGEDITKYAYRDGKQVAGYSPNAKFHELLDEVREKKGEVAAQEVLALVNGALGRHPAGHSMPGWVRTSSEFITGWIGMTVLAFSGVASIPELALPILRSGGRVGIGQMFSDLQQAKRFARDMGIVISDASEQVLWNMTGEQYRSPTISKIQAKFFKYNGNEWIVRTARTLGTSIGIRFLLNSAAINDSVALGKLNIDAGTIHAWDQAGRPTWSPDLDPTTAEIAAKVGEAVSQFVNEATLNPSKFQATHWGNNPWLKMIWHLKHFLYSYGDTVLGGIYREMSTRWKHLDPKQFNQALAIAAPAILFGVAIMPLAAASLEVRDWFRYFDGKKGKEYESSMEYAKAIFDRAGGLGPLEFLTNMRQQQEWGMSVFGSIAPVPAKVDMIFGPGSWTNKARQMTPIWSQNKTMFGLLD